LEQENGTWQVIGDPTEGALLVLGSKAGLSKVDLERASPALGEVPFDSERKKMTVVRQAKSGPVAYVKGAPDMLLRDCTVGMMRDGQLEPLTDEMRRQVESVNRHFASHALRVLGIAMRPLDRVPDTYTAAILEQGLTFLGLVGMKDPIRPEAKKAVEVCQNAGIRTVMITGDHKDTAIAIARDLGIIGSDAQALSGEDLSRLSDEELDKRVTNTAVYARVSAEHKLRVVRAWKRRGAVVAMTGDGVNDAPALKAADIGVAMGITGTDVTKEASDMVVTDDNFASIAAAVEEGRGVYDNIRKAVHFLLSCNLSEILLMLLATLFALPLPLLPVQILWINLVTDGLPALALAVDPKDPDLMRRPPRAPDERFLTKERILLMFGQGMFLGLIAMLAFVYCLYGMDLSLERARTVTFAMMVLVQLVHSLNCRNDRRSLFAIGLWTNRPLLWAIAVSAFLQASIVLIPALHPIFRVTTFDPVHWFFVASVGVFPLLAMEAWKMLTRSPSDLQHR
jgi:Ca2+-transporting ATPase